MRIRILSDLHREFGATSIPRRDCDLIILAGDIATKLNALPWIREFCGDTPTVYVCGNHEFYGARFPRVREQLQALTAGSNIHLLEDDHFELHGWNIYGCSLWTDLALGGDWREGTAICAELMNDYKRIRNSRRGYRRLIPQDTRNAHLLSVARMGEFFKTHDPKHTVVVTHHAPSALSLPEFSRNRIMSCAYASHLDAFVEEHQPFLWVHGHTHHSSDYHIGQTRIVANPQGYPEEPNENFVPDLVVEI